MCNSFFQIFLKKFLRGKIHSLFWGLNEIFSTKLGAKRAKSLPVLFQRGCQSINRSADSLPPSRLYIPLAWQLPPQRELRRRFAPQSLSVALVLKLCSRVLKPISPCSNPRSCVLKGWARKKPDKSPAFCVFRICIYVYIIIWFRWKHRGFWRSSSLRKPL